MRDIRRYEMLVRLKEFGVAHSDFFPASSPGGQLFAALTTAVEDLRSHVVTQATGERAARTGTSAKTAARETLRKALVVVSRTAQTIAVGTPGLADKFRRPRSDGDQQVLAAAKAIVEVATPLKDEFIAHNLPATFLEELTAAIGAFEQAIGGQAKARETRAGARAEIDKTIAAGLTTAKHLDTVVVNRLEGDAGLLAEWRSARHVARVSARNPGREEPTPSAPATNAA
jgi:hypothetical protein